MTERKGRSEAEDGRRRGPAPQDRFYRLEELELDAIRELLREAHEKSFECRVDKLDCEESWGRQKVDMSFEEVMEKADEDTMYSFIHRYNTAMWNNPYYEGEDRDHMGRPEEYLEIGFRTGDIVDYFLFLHVDIGEKEHFVDRYGLEEQGGG